MTMTKISGGEHAKANIPIRIVCCNRTSRDSAWHGPSGLLRDGPAHRDFQLPGAAGRFRDVRGEIDFTGLHYICLADNSEVTGTVAGHLVQRTAANGDTNLSFNEVLSYGGGTLGYRGEASLTGGNSAKPGDNRRCRHRSAQGNPRPGNIRVHRPDFVLGRHLLRVRTLTRRVATRNLCLSGIFG